MDVMTRRDTILICALGGVGVVLLALGIWGTFIRPDERADTAATVRGASLPALNQVADSSAVSTGGTDARPSGPMVQPTTAAPTPSHLPRIHNLVVCDMTVDCGLDPSQTAWPEVTACFSTQPEDTGRSLSIAITLSDVPPLAHTDPAVIARSSVVQGAEAFRCYPVRAVTEPLSKRVYWLWVLAEGAVVGQRQVQLER
jgi:hypothetical protein